MSQTPTKKKKRIRFFNIDTEAQRYYPRNPVLVPATAGVQPYNLRRLHGIDVFSMRHFRATLLQRSFD